MDSSEPSPLRTGETHSGFVKPVKWFTGSRGIHLVDTSVELQDRPAPRSWSWFGLFVNTREIDEQIELLDRLPPYRPPGLRRKGWVGLREKLD